MTTEKHNNKPIISNTPGDDKKTAVTFRTNAAAKLIFSAYPWWGFMLLQGGLLLNAWNGRKAEQDILHTVSMLLAAISVYCMFSFGSVLRGNENPKAYKSLAIYFLVMCCGSLILLLAASFISGPNLLGYPNIFRNLVITTGSPQGMRSAWFVLCAVFAAMAFILFGKSRKG